MKIGLGSGIRVFRVFRWFLLTNSLTLWGEHLVSDLFICISSISSISAAELSELWREHRGSDGISSVFRLFRLFQLHNSLSSAGSGSDQDLKYNPLIPSRRCNSISNSSRRGFLSLESEALQEGRRALLLQSLRSSLLQHSSSKSSTASYK